MTRRINSAEATAYPVWVILSGKRTMRFEAGPWFSREAAEVHLQAKAHRYPKSAYVYCASGHMSGDYRALCDEAATEVKP